jgi:hypothetical protein
MLAILLAAALASIPAGCASRAVPRDNAAGTERDANTEDVNRILPLDSWEAADGARRPALASCTEIPSALVVPLPEQARPAAITRLESVETVALDDAEAAGLLSLPPSSDHQGATLAARLVDEAIEQVYQAQRTGDWSVAFPHRLDALEELARSGVTSRLRPFLVRAIAKIEHTGGFEVGLCGDTLQIVHGSLGHRVPPSTRVPLVVFLEHAPASLYVSWSMAA